jgi:hypothetical protein
MPAGFSVGGLLFVNFPVAILGGLVHKWEIRNWSAPR